MSLIAIATGADLAALAAIANAIADAVVARITELRLTPEIVLRAI
jgi:CO/xanthine dehydrogenase Mo-binding subunit